MDQKCHLLRCAVPIITTQRHAFAAATLCMPALCCTQVQSESAAGSGTDIERSQRWAPQKKKAVTAHPVVKAAAVAYTTHYAQRPYAPCILCTQPTPGKQLGILLERGTHTTQVQPRVATTCVGSHRPPPNNTEQHHTRVCRNTSAEFYTNSSTRQHTTAQVQRSRPAGSTACAAARCSHGCSQAT
jgi:hypothetical protein